MPTHQTELAIDFGEVGHWNETHPFRVRLDSRPLIELIRASEAAHRLYELLLIERPGDIWDYVTVVLEDVPPRFAERVAHAREEVDSAHDSAARPWPAGQIPFRAFDALFQWAGDDTDPESEAWLGHRDQPPMRSYAQQALAIARTAQSRLEWNDPLLRHVAARVRAGELAYCYRDRATAREESRAQGPNPATHTPAFGAHGAGDDHRRVAATWRRSVALGRRRHGSLR